MEYRQLGTTGEKISAVGMGTWRIGSYNTSEERSEQVKALKRGIELGMNLIDTAEEYASGRSEEVVGEAIRGARESVFIATKVSPGHLHFDDVLRACRGSLRRLGVPYIDLYQIHWPNPSIPITETMSAMEKLVEDGLVRYIGVSNFNASEVHAAKTALSKVVLASNQVEYSLKNRYVEPELLPYCIREKITLIAYSPLARGSIMGTLPGALTKKYGLTPAQMMLNWVTRNQRVVAIPKAASLDHVEENASSVSVRLSDSEYDQIANA